jgi:hypothetical protein
MPAPVATADLQAPRLVVVVTADLLPARPLVAAGTVDLPQAPRLVVVVTADLLPARPPAATVDLLLARPLAVTANLPAHPVVTANLPAHPVATANLRDNPAILSSSLRRDPQAPRSAASALARAVVST